MSTSETTTDHAQIRNWATSRGGHPAKVSTGGDGGILRIDFGEPEETLEQISWDEFFEIFDSNDLAPRTFFVRNQRRRKCPISA